MHFHDGTTAEAMHNAYPVLYERVTREAVEAFEAVHPGRQIAFYTRAGYSGEPGSAAYESFNFPGDETTDWSQPSGLASLTRDMLNRAIGGAYGYSTDIGGYFDLASPPTTHELFVRWAEWAALSPLFRLHGALDTGAHAVGAFDPRGGAYPQALGAAPERAPLIEALWHQADETGMPITRPLYLQYPQDPRAAEQDQEWLRPDVLVAPVVEEGARARSVYFPAGCWRDPERAWKRPVRRRRGFRRSSTSCHSSSRADPGRSRHRGSSARSSSNPARRHGCDRWPVPGQPVAPAVQTPRLLIDG